TTAREESAFLMQQNALVIRNGEHYYRTAVSDNAESWNIRDRHMAQTVRRLLEKGGPDSKIIIWAHNTHVGDARYTDMAAAGMVNLGQLAREEFGEAAVYAVGFGSYEGKVIAADYWGGAIRSMQVPKAQPGTWEALLHSLGDTNRILLSSEIAAIEQLQKPIGHRAIGVVYNPASERGNYVPSRIAKRYDAFIYIDRTTALHPLGTQPKNEPPDTYPTGY
ncbi:MAG TPA: erythromycin esterase family protein, partial [Hymenobacter sp.]